MYFSIRKSPADRQWYWRLRAANHEIIAHGEGYTSKSGCLHAIRLVDGGRNLPIYEI